MARETNYLATWFWTEILGREKTPDRFRDRQFKIVQRHAKFLLEEGYDPDAVMRVLQAMRDVGIQVKALTQVRWEYRSGRSYYDVIIGPGSEAPVYERFALLLTEDA